jgi:hypothetical protein
MAKASSSRTASNVPRPVPRGISLEASESGVSEKSDEDSMVDEEDEEDDASANSDALEGVEPRRRIDVGAQEGGPSRNGASSQLP